MVSLEFQSKFSASVCGSSRCQSMTRPSPDIFEASSIQSCDTRAGAFSYYSDARPVRTNMCEIQGLHAYE